MDTRKRGVTCCICVGACNLRVTPACCVCVCSVDQASVAYVAFTACILTQIITVSSECTTPTKLNHLVHCCCVLLYCASVGALTTLPVLTSFSAVYGVVAAAACNGAAGLTVCLSSVLACLPWLLSRHARAVMRGLCGNRHDRLSGGAEYEMESLLADPDPAR